MNDKNFKELEKIIGEELLIVDSYKFPIIKNDVKKMREYFANKFYVSVESIFITSLEECGKKYSAIFTKIPSGGKI